MDKETIREILNKWFKKQRRITDIDGKAQGYFITKSQCEKLKKILWREEKILWREEKILWREEKK